MHIDACQSIRTEQNRRFNHAVKKVCLAIYETRGNHPKSEISQSLEGHCWAHDPTWSQESPNTSMARWFHQTTERIKTVKEKQQKAQKRPVQPLDDWASKNTNWGKIVTEGGFRLWVRKPSPDVHQDQTAVKWILQTSGTALEKYLHWHP